MDLNEIQKHLNEGFSNIYDCFVDNKPSLHFGKDKTKSILFSFRV